MRIVFITPSFYPSIGGVEEHVLRVSNELIKRGHQVTVITQWKDDYKQRRRKSDNEAKEYKKVEESALFVHKKLDQTNIYYFKFGNASFFKKFKIWYYLIRSYSLILSSDIIHCHDVFIWYFPFKFLFPFKKVYTTFHGYEGKFPPEEKSIWIRKVSEKLSSGVICVGDFIKRWYGTSPDAVTYGGVRKILNVKFQMSNVLIKNKKIKILLVGRLEKDIGIQVYIDAIRKLKRKGTHFELTVCGEGKFRPDLEKLGNVLGFVPDVYKYIKKADIIFASSYLSMLQAMQMGKPVFAVYTNPLKHDYLYSSPFSKYIYISHTPKELEKSIMRYIPNKRRLEAGRKWANAQTWESVTDIYLDLWS